MFFSVLTNSFLFSYPLLSFPVPPPSIFTGSSSFASTTQRKTYDVIDAPPPGSYEVVSATDNWVKKGGKGLIGSGPERFRSQRGGKARVGGSKAGAGAEDPIASEPGPGSYSVPSTIKRPPPNRKNIFVSNEKRFQGSDAASAAAELPGPGSYDVDFAYGNFNKRTFNMTIVEQEAGLA